MTPLNGLLLYAAALPLFCATATAACVQIRTAADLNQIRNNPFGDFCIVADIDLATVSNFAPLGNGTPFMGVLDGRGHAIRNLKVRSTGRAGLFDRIGGIGPSTSIREPSC